MWSADEKVDITGRNGQTWVGVLDPLTGSLDTRLLTEFNHDMFCPGECGFLFVASLIHSHLVYPLHVPPKHQQQQRTWATAVS